MMKKVILISLLLFLYSFSKAQELNTRVSINTPKLQTVDPKVFKTLENTIREFMNNTKWTEDEFQPSERIDCNITINIKEELGPTAFTSELFIQASRPVFGSGYKTVILEHKDDKFNFTYEEFQPLEYIESAYVSNLTSVLAFYAYYILGLDYDSFSQLGGAPYFQQANNIMNTVPQGLDGWSAMENPTNRNRYWMIESILNPRSTPLREASYLYHRGGLDFMAESKEKGLEGMVNALTKVRNVNTAYPNALAVRMFVNAKSDEIIDIMLGAPSNQRRSVYSVMIKIDPAKASKYTPIRR